jgi:hypothetical protein
MIRKKSLLFLLPLLAAIAMTEVDWFAKKTVAVHEQHQKPTLKVTHRVQGRDLHLHMSVTGFAFSLENMGKENRYGEGHVHLYLDGRKVAKVFANHYVYANIPIGRHAVVVELAHNNHESYGVKQSFLIDVK